jgi:hypothetical protein
MRSSCHSFWKVELRDQGDADGTEIQDQDYQKMVPQSQMATTQPACQLGCKRLGYPQGGCTLNLVSITVVLNNPEMIDPIRVHPPEIEVDHTCKLRGRSENIISSYLNRHQFTELYLDGINSNGFRSGGVNRQTLESE